MPNRWPGSFVASDAQDLIAPLMEVLEAAGLTVAPDADKPFGVIESTALKLTMEIRARVALAGGLSAIASGAGSLWAGLSENTPLAIALAASSGVIIAASAIGVAWVASTDIRSRTITTASQVQARASTARVYLDRLVLLRMLAECGCGGPDPAAEVPAAAPIQGARREAPELPDAMRIALTAFGRELSIDTGAGPTPIKGVEWDDDGLRLKVAEGR